MRLCRTRWVGDVAAVRPSYGPVAGRNDEFSVWVSGQNRVENGSPTISARPGPCATMRSKPARTTPPAAERAISSSIVSMSEKPSAAGGRALRTFGADDRASAASTPSSHPGARLRAERSSPAPAQRSFGRRRRDRTDAAPDLAAGFAADVVRAWASLRLVLGNPWMRPNARQSTPVPPAVRAPAHRSASCAASPAPPDRRSATPTSSPGRKRRDRTSRPARPGRDRCPPGRSCRATSPRSLPCENGDFEPKPLARSALLTQVRSVASRLIARLPEYCCGAPLPSRRVPRPDRRSGNALSPRSKARGDQGHKRRERW